MSQGQSEQMVIPWADWWADVHPTGVAALMYLAMLQAAIAASVPWPGKVG